MWSHWHTVILPYCSFCTKTSPKNKLFQSARRVASLCSVVNLCKHNLLQLAVWPVDGWMDAFSILHSIYIEMTTVFIAGAHLTKVCCSPSKEESVTFFDLMLVYDSTSFWQTAALHCAPLLLPYLSLSHFWRDKNCIESFEYFAFKGSSGVPFGTQKPGEGLALISACLRGFQFLGCDCDKIGTCYPVDRKALQSH